MFVMLDRFPCKGLLGPKICVFCILIDTARLLCKNSFVLPLCFPRWLSSLLSSPVLAPCSHPTRGYPKVGYILNFFLGSLVSRHIVAPGQCAYLGKEIPARFSCRCLDHILFSYSAKPGLVRRGGFRSKHRERARGGGERGGKWLSE